MKLSYTLSLGNVLHEFDVTYSLRFLPCEGDDIGELSIIGCPIGILLIICHIGSLVVAFLTSLAHIIGTYSCFSCKIFTKALLDQITRFDE